MKKYTSTSILFTLLVATYCLSPAFVYGADTPPPPVTSLIPCGQMINGVLKECTFGDLMKLVQNVIDYAVTFLIIPGAVISFALVGWKILTNPANSTKRSEALSSMRKVVIGLVVILAAWLIVKTVLVAFLDPAVVQKVPINF